MRSSCAIQCSVIFTLYIYIKRALLIALRITESFDHVCTNSGHKFAQATVNVCPQYGTFFMLPFWHQNFEADPKFLENFWTPAFVSNTQISVVIVSS